LAFKNSKYDLLFFGNSLVLDGVDTEYLNEVGLASFNFAISGSSVETNIIQLEEYLKKNNKPKLIIYGLSSCIGKINKSDNIHPLVKFPNHLEFNDLTFPLSFFRWKIIELAKFLVSENHRNAYLSFGQLKISKKVKDTTRVFQHNKFSLEKIGNTDNLEKFSKLCKKENIRIVFVDMPGYKNTRYDISDLNDSVGRFNLFDFPLIQFNTTEFGIQFDENNDWLGNSHLNKYGALKFTKSLLKVLINDKYVD
jgi:MFS superfamily sulfate permease-like transporter